MPCCLVHDFVVRVHRTVARLLALGAAFGARTRRLARGRACRARSGLLVHRGGRLVPYLLQRLGRRCDGGRVVALERFLEAAQARLDPRLETGVELLTMLLQVLLDLVRHLVAAVAGLDLLPALLVLARVLLGVLHHALDVALVESARGLDPDALLLGGRAILRRD